MVETLNRWWCCGTSGGGEQHVQARSRVRAKRRTRVGQLSDVLLSLRAKVLSFVRAQISVQEVTLEQSPTQILGEGYGSVLQPSGSVPLVKLTSDNVAIPSAHLPKHDLVSLLPSHIVNQLHSEVLKKKLYRIMTFHHRKNM